MFLRLFLLVMIVLSVECGDYTKMDNVVSLNSTTFPENISSGRWLLVFYRQSCGACQNFSPLFQEMANSVEPWKPLITVGSIDCENRSNQGLCMKHNISGVPTLWYYPGNPEQRKSNPLGMPLKPRFDSVTDMQKRLLVHMMQEIPKTSEQYGLLQRIIENSRTSAAIEQQTTTAEPPKPLGPYKLIPVYADDIFKSLSLMLYSDVSMMPIISGEALRALNEFLDMLILLFPGSPDYMAKLKELSKWSSSQDSFTGHEWLEQLQNIKVPEFKGDFVACKGSKPTYRGYPCGLWLLFHSLTVEHLLKEQKTPTLAGDLVAHAMNRFIPRFFSCLPCAFHFAANSANIIREGENIFPDNRNWPPVSEFKWDPAILTVLPKAPTSALEEVLWLNAVHNRVNHRLAKSITEDPQAPKITYPPKTVCPQCWSEDPENPAKGVIGGIEQTKNHLLSFLVNHYQSAAWVANKVPGSLFSKSNPIGESESTNTELLIIVIVSVLITIGALIGVLLISRFFWPCRRRRTQPAYTGAHFA